MDLRPIPGFPGYYASDEGGVYSMRTGELRRISAHERRGYLRVNVRSGSCRATRKLVLVHTLVLLAFDGPRPEGFEARHLNGVATDNRAENLRWGTSKENYQDAVNHGTQGWGNDKGATKLSDDDVERIRQRAASGEKHTDLAVEFGVTQTHVTAIVHRKTRTRRGRRSSPRGYPIRISSALGALDRAGGQLSPCEGSKVSQGGG